MEKRKMIAELISVASVHAHSDMHKDSLVEFDSLNAGFTYVDSWGQEHTVHLCFDSEDTLEIVLITNPLPDCMMDDQGEISVIRIPVMRDFSDEIIQVIDDYMYRDDPVMCGNEKSYSLIP